MKEEQVLDAATTALNEKVAGLKLKYAVEAIHLVTVDGHDFFFRPPTRIEVKAMSAVSERDQMAASEMAVETLLVDGDRELYEKDTSVYLALINSTSAMMTAKSVVLKKL